MDEELAYFHSNYRNYNSAIKIYKHLLKTTHNFEDILHYNEEIKINRLKNNISGTKSMKPGEAFFPIYHEKYSLSSLCKVVIQRSPSISTNGSDVQFIANKAVSYLDEQIKAIDPKIMVLDWGVQNLSVNFTFPDGEPFTEKIEGNSYSLAIAAAILSFLLDEPLSFNQVFSGSLRENSNDVFPVQHIESKIDILKIERPGLKAFYIPKVNGLKEKKIIEIQNLNQLFDSLFGAKFTAIFKRKKFQLGERRITLKTVKKIKTLDGKMHDYAIFEHPDNITPEETKRIIGEYLEPAIDLLVSKKGVIVDGLRPAELYARLGSLAKDNHVSNFIAVRRYKKGDDKDNISRACVFVIAKVGAERALGESFEYYLPKK